MAPVLFLDVEGVARWIRDTGPEQMLTDLTDQLAADFDRWQSFTRIPRLAEHHPHGVIELMPASDGEFFAFKYVNGHPINPSRGLQTVAAFGVLADVETGYPLLVAEMTILTALRTAATSALAARHLARDDCRTMAFVGVGAQAEFQALALRSATGVKLLQVHDPDQAAVEKFVRNMTPYGFEVNPTGSAREAVLGADVVTTCTADKRRVAVLTRDMVEPGMHVNALGGDCPGKTELDPELLRAATVFVEHEPQTRTEGEIQQLEPSFGVTELWRTVRGEAPGRTWRDEVTVFDSVGFAIEDFSVLAYALRAVGGTDLVQEIDLVPSPASPKDLFGAYVADPTPSTGPGAR